jgi:hypothetical protein
LKKNPGQLFKKYSNRNVVKSKTREKMLSNGCQSIYSLSGGVAELA